MVNGLSLGLAEFRSLPQKQKLDCLYENQCRTFLAIKGYKFHQRVQYPWLVVLTGAAIFIIKHAVSS